jgi:hypothetical protein
MSKIFRFTVVVVPNSVFLDLKHWEVYDFFESGINYVKKYINSHGQPARVVGNLAQVGLLRAVCNDCDILVYVDPVNND